MLTIVIPTADRHEFLLDTVGNLCEEIAKSQYRIEIVIADNASSPPIQIELFDKFSTNQDIKLVRFDERVDIGYSIIRSALLSTTEYVWVFGDDDVLRPGAISDVVWHLRETKPAYIYLNKYMANGDLSYFEGVLHPIEIIPYRIVQGDDAVREFVHHPGFITSLIFKRELLASGAEQFEERFPGYGFLISIYFNSLSDKVLYVSHPHLIQRRSNVLWKKNWPRFWLVAVPEAFEWLEKAGVVGAKSCAMKAVRKIWIRTFFSAKAFGIDAKNDFWARAAKNFTIPEKIVIYTIKNIIPVFIASWLYLALMKMKGLFERVKHKLR